MEINVFNSVKKDYSCFCKEGKVLVGICYLLERWSRNQLPKLNFKYNLGCQGMAQ